MTIRRAGPGSIAALACAILVACGAATARADAPRPLSFGLFSFPGALQGPPSANSAGLALSDRWLGDEPSGNPAVAPGFRVVLSPTVMRVNRQDLASHNRNFSETAAFFDGAGFTVGLPPLAGFGFVLYGYQPVLRFEDTAYISGLSVPGPATPPASVQAHAAQRETRAGLAIARGFGALRAGAAVEWTRRDDQYRRIYHGGSMDDGTTEVSFSGGALGGQAGLRYDRGDSTAGSYTVAAALRAIPALTLDGEQSVETLSESSLDATTVHRSGGIEAGLSARYVAGPTFRALASIGGRSSQRWDDYGVEAGSGWSWALGGEFHDTRDPWTLRFGFGGERENDVPEPRAGILGLGFGWRFDDATLDVGLVHRTVTRDDAPNSFDDRVVVSIRVPR
jgi:hypothetical protein